MCVCVAGAGAAESYLGAPGGSDSQEEPHRRSGSRDPHAEREHQLSHQGAGAQGQRGAEDPQRSQPADQVHS